MAVGLLSGLLSTERLPDRRFGINPDLRITSEFSGRWLPMAGAVQGWTLPWVPRLAMGIDGRYRAYGGTPGAQEQGSGRPKVGRCAARRVTARRACWESPGSRLRVVYVKYRIYVR